MNLLTRTTAAALIAGGVVSIASSASAVPLGASLALRDASTPAVQTVRWRGWGGVGIGLAAGAFVGAIAASRYSYGWLRLRSRLLLRRLCSCLLRLFVNVARLRLQLRPGLRLQRLQRLQRLRLCARLRIPLFISLRLCLPALPGARLHRALSSLAPLVIAAPRQARVRTRLSSVIPGARSCSEASRAPADTHSLCRTFWKAKRPPIQPAGRRTPKPLLLNCGPDVARSPLRSGEPSGLGCAVMA